MSFNQTYYLDIDSNYRDESVYPNPTDFTIPFKTNTSTGYYALGEPLNTDSYFEAVSIDPNFANDNINITNGYVTNIKILETAVFVSGVMYPGNTTFRYLNTGILSLTGVCNVSAFLGRFDITELGDIPYTFNWIVYSDSTGPISSFTTRSTFTFDLLDNIYWTFDSRNQYINIYYRNSLSANRITYNTLLNVDNGANAIEDWISVDTTSVGFYSNNIGLFILYFDQNGNKGSYDNHDWGYHVISDPQHNISTFYSSSPTQNKFNIKVDNGNNLIVSFNESYNLNFAYANKVFASRTTTGSQTGATLIGTLPTGSSGSLQQYNFYGMYDSVNSFSNTGGNYVLTNMVYGDFGVVDGARKQPYFSISKDLSTGTVIHSVISVTNAVFNVSQPSKVVPIKYNDELYLILSYGRYSSASTGVSFPLNIMKVTHDMTTGYLIASSSGPVSYEFYQTGLLLGDNVYIGTRRSELDRTFIMYKYNIPTNSVLNVATGACTGSSIDWAEVLTYEQSGYVYSVVMESGLNFKNYIFRFEPTTNSLIQTSTFLGYNALWAYISDKRDNGKIYLYISYNRTPPTILVVDISDPFNPILTTFSPTFGRFGPTLYTYLLKNNTTRTLLFGNYSAQGEIYDVTVPTSPILVTTNNQRYLGGYNALLGGSSTGVLYGLSSQRNFNAQSLYKYPFFNNINIYSTHYSTNVQLSINLNTGYNLMDKFNIGNFLYFVISNSTSFDIYITSSLVNTSLIFTKNILLPSTISNLKSYYFNDCIYILLLSTNYYEIYTSNFINSSNPIISSFTVLTSKSVLNLLDTTLGFAYNKLLLMEVYYTKYDYYIYDGSSFSNIFTYTQTNPIYIPAFSSFFYDSINSQSYIYISKNNTTSFTDHLIDVYRITSTGSLVNNLINFFFVNGITKKCINLTPYNLSTSSYINNVIRIGRGFTATGSANNLQRSIISTNSTSVTNVSYSSLSIFSSIEQCFDAIIDGNTILSAASVINLSNTGTSYLRLARATNTNTITTLTSSQVLFPSNVRGIGLFKTDIALYVIALLNNNSLYLYDLTNITFALNNQGLTKTAKINTFEHNLSSAYIHKILQDGTPSTINYIGSSFYEPTIINNNIEISNFDISENYENIILSGSWKDNVYFKQSTSTGYINANFFTEPLRSFNCFISNMDINLNYKYAIPLIGPISNAINKLQINNLDGYTSFVGTSSSKYFYIYNPQTSGNLTQPSIIQRVFNIISTSNGFLISIDNDTGTLVNNLLVFTNDQSRNITLLDLAIDDYQTSIIGTSNANNLRILSNDILYDQVLYSNIQASSSFNIFMFVISNSGSLLYSNLIDCSPNVFVFIQDIKQDQYLNRIYFTPYFTLVSGTGPISIYNRDGTLAKRDTIIGGNNFYSLVFQYVYDPLYTDKNGVQYSQIVYINPPTYPFIDENFNNYLLFLIGNVDNVDVNGNYFVRYNEYDGTNYKLILNTIIDTTTIIKQFSTINNITGSNNYFNMQLSSSYLEGYIIYDLNTVPNLQNQIIATTEIAEIDTDSFYYFMIPFQSSTGTINKLIPITNIDINSAGNFVFTVEDINDLRVSLPSGAFYGPYLPIVVPNDKLYSVIPFFGSSIFTPIYYNITLDSITLPNRPIKNLQIPGSRGFNDIPFFYVSIYPVDDEGNYDPETVNVVYTNTKLLVLPSPIFKIQSFETSETANFVTFNSITTPIIKFDKNYANLRITIYDPDGEVILFDTSATKESDADFLYGLLPTTLVNMYLRITLTKR